MHHQAQIRSYIRILMGRSASDDDFDTSHIATQDQLANFVDERAQGRCCTLEAFRLDLTGTPHSTWNESAFKVFLPGFLQRHPATNNRTEISTAFFHHLRTLKKQYTGSGSSTQDRSRNARYQRRINVSAHYRSLLLTRITTSVISNSFWIAELLALAQDLTPTLAQNY
jgi:hypothetical protein